MLGKHLSFVSWLLFGLLCLSPIALGQVTTGTISGTVKDETEALLPGVEVTVKNLETGISRTVLSDEQGRYRATNLNVGNYEVLASLPGFQTMIRRGMVLTIGREAIVNFELKIGEITEQVTVTGEAPLVETTSGSLGDLVDRQTILELPLNGRDLQGLLTLQAGVVNARTASGDRAGFGQRISISGARPQDSSMLMDGTEAKGFDAGGPPAGISRSFLGAEGVQEFKLERNAYGAQFGGVGGGAMNIASKGGTNDFHGSAYWYHRNDNLDAAQFRDPVQRDTSGKVIGRETPEFKRNQLGFSVGGPIVKNRTFFFGNYEALRERLGFTGFLGTLTREARQGLLPDPRTGQLRQVPVNPEMIPYFALWPLPGPGAQDLGDGTAREPVAKNEPTDETLYSARIDHQFSDSDSIFGRWQRTAGDRLRTKDVKRFFGLFETANTFITSEYKKILSAQWLSTFRFGHNRRFIGQRAWEDPPTDPALHFVPPSAWKAPRGAPPALGEFSAPGISAVGLGAVGDTWLAQEQRNTTYAGDLVYNRGAHSLKFGFSWLNIKYTAADISRPGGNFTFSSIQDFLLGLPATFRGDILPAPVDVFPRDIRTNIIGWYVQEDWKAHPRLSLNLGFRHEFFTVPSETRGQISNLRQPFTQKEPSLGDPWFLNPSFKSIMPRLGLAWDPTGSGKTAIRAGAGIFYNHIPTETYRTTSIRNPPWAEELNIRGVGNIPFPGTKLFERAKELRAAGTLTPVIYLMPFDYMKNPHMIQWNLNIQREILPQTAVTIGYAGSRGINLIHAPRLNAARAETVNGRLVIPAGATVQNRHWQSADLRNHETDANSWYHSFQLGVQRRFHGGFQMQSSYTFSRTLDTSSSWLPTFSNDGGTAYYWARHLNKGLAAFHVSNTSTSNFVWQLPWGSGQRFGGGWPSWVDAILGGWQAGGILTLASGPPVSIDKSSRSDMSVLFVPDSSPDLLPGASINPVLGGPDRYFDTLGFVVPPARTIGNLGRNTMIGPGVANFDFSLSKNIRLTEEAGIQFRGEFFNLFNRPNFALPETSIFDSRGRRRGNAGFISRTTTTARQIQFALRIEF